jgi:predicted nucleic acid-binding protein
MSERLILVDTSAWITYLRSEADDGPYPLRGLGQNNFLGTNHLIRVELLSGASDEQDYRVLEHQLSMLRDVPLSEPVWSHAARLRWTLCRKGGPWKAGTF